MGFHHTLFVRQSIENVEELKKYMYSSKEPTAQGTDAGTPSTPPSQEQEGANTPQSKSTAMRSTSAQPPFPLQGTYGEKVPTKSAIYTEGVRNCLNASRLSAAKPQAEGAYDRAIGQAVPLFWAIYIAIHGYEEYAQIGRGYSNFEINEKQKIIATIQKSPTILKQTNQKMTKDKIQEVMSEVMSGKNMGLSTLPAFATVYNKRIIVILKNTMRIDISSEGAEDTIVIRKNNKGMFVPDLDANVGIIERETYCFHQIDKPLRPVSTYKLDELVGIAGLLEVPYENKKKPELYVELVQKCI